MTDRTSKPDYPFLRGGGEMGELARSFDWSVTSLGTPDHWPAELRTAAGMILCSSFPMLLWWGDELIQFYNDAFRPSLGRDGKHPASFGQPALGYWAENWHVIGPLIEKVMQCGESAYFENLPIPNYRNGRIEEVFWTFSYSPVLDELGKPLAVLMTCFETTDNIRNLAALAEESDQLAFAIEATELGTWDLNPATGRFTGNARLKKWFGLQPEDEIPLSTALACIIERDRQRVTDLIAQALQYESGGIYDTEYTIIAQGTGQERIVRAKGRAWFDDRKVVYRFNGTLQDITAERKAMEQHNAARVLADLAVRGSGIGVFNIRIDDGTMEYTPQFAAILTGNPEAGYITHKTFIERIHPDDEPVRIAAERAALANGEFSYEARVLREDHSVHWLRIMGVTIPDAGGHPVLFSGTVQDVTEERTARQSLADSEAKFRALIEEAPVATCLFVGRDMRIEVANDAMIGLWGKDQRVLGMPLADALPELSGQPFLDILDHVFTTGLTYEAKSAPAQLEVNGVLSTYYFDFTYKPLKDSNGRIYGIMDMAVDVTDQVISRRRLEESEQFSRSVFYNSPVAKLVYIGEHMVIREANEKMLDILGSDASIIGRPILESVPLLAETNLYEQYLRVLHTGNTHTEYAAPITLLKDGKRYAGHYDYALKALRDTAGTIYGVICTAVDVTHNVAATRRLEESEAGLRNAIELAGLGTWTIDLVRDRITYPERVAGWLGAPSGGSQHTWFGAIPQEEAMRVQQIFADALQPGADGLIEAEHPIVNVRTGQSRVIHSRGTVLRNGAGLPVAISGTSQDITIQRALQAALEIEVQERTEELAATVEELMATNDELAARSEELDQAVASLQTANEELAESNMALVRSNEELEQYAYVASHDLQEPLRKILVFAGMLQAQSDLPDAMRLSVEKIGHSAQRMSLLIKDLLEFSRLLKADALFRPVRLNLIATDVISDFELTIKDRNALITLGTLPTISGIGLQMNQLFHNLFSNAFKFARLDVPLKVSVYAEAMSGAEVQRYIAKPLEGVRYHHISFADNGIGFEAAYAEQIFEVFKRLHTREMYPGSGIGLALCRRIVNNHGGVMFATSVPGEGTTFHMILPEQQPMA